MNDRLRFRVWITVPITRDVEEEKEVSFYIYDIALYNDGSVGFSRDSLLEVLDKLNLTEGQYNEIEDYISDNSYSEDWEWYIISFDIIEQCTGLKDRNGRLIYEGDLIKLLVARNRGWIPKGTIAPVEWNNFACCGFILSCMGNLTEKCAKNCEVIGNIHENKEVIND